MHFLNHLNAFFIEAMFSNFEMTRFHLPSNSHQCTFGTNGRAAQQVVDLPYGVLSQIQCVNSRLPQMNKLALF